MTETLTVLNNEAVNDALLAIAILDIFDAGKQERIFTNSRSLNLNWDTLGFLVRDYLRARLPERVPVLKRRRSMSRNYLRYEISPNLRGYNFRNLEQNISFIRETASVPLQNVTSEGAGLWLAANEAMRNISPLQDSDALPGITRNWRDYEINVEQLITSVHSVNPVMILNRLGQEISHKIPAADAAHRFQTRQNEIALIEREEQRRQEARLRAEREAEAGIRRRQGEQARGQQAQQDPPRVTFNRGFAVGDDFPGEYHIAEGMPRPEPTPQTDNLNDRIVQQLIQELNARPDVNTEMDNTIVELVRESHRPLTQEDISAAQQQFQILADNHRR